MFRFQILLALLVPIQVQSSPPPDAQASEEVTDALVCLRKASGALECGDLDAFLEAHDAARDAALAERRQGDEWIRNRERREAHGVIEL